MIPFVPRPTKRGYGLGLAAGILIVIGSNAQAGWMYVLAAVLLGTLVAGVVTVPAMVRGLELVREAPSEGFAGEPLRVDLVLRNRGRGRKMTLLVRDPHIAPTTLFLPLLGPHEVVVLETIRRAARRGIVDGRPIEIASEGPFGVAVARRRVAAPGRTVIFPRIVPVDWPSVAVSGTPMHAVGAPGRKGVGGDFLGVREYRPGDAIRHVHWPTSARAGTLVVREFEQELPRPLGVVVDTWSDFGKDESILDVACSVAGSLAAQTDREHRPVAVAAATLNSPPITLVADAPLEETLTMLAGLAPSGIPLAEALPQALPLLGRVDMLVLIAPTWDVGSPTAIRDALKTVDRTRTHVVVVAIHAATYGAPQRGRVLDSAGTDRLVRTTIETGATVYLVRKDRELATCLSQPLAA